MLRFATLTLLAVCTADAQTSSTFNCNNGQLIPARWKCDADNDCGDWSDEAACTSCTARNHLCVAMQKCIPKTYICDGDDDCGDGSDEINCDSCSRGQFLCSNRKCIPYANECDGKDDCGDNSDESSYDCRKLIALQVDYNYWDRTTTYSTTKRPQPTTTPEVMKTVQTAGNNDWSQTYETEFSAKPSATQKILTTAQPQTMINNNSDYTCGSREIIPSYYLCDGYPDCGDGSDEQSCLKIFRRTGDYRRKKTKEH